MLSHEEFSYLLTAAYGQDKPARLKLIDEYDKARKLDGVYFAEQHLKSRIVITRAIHHLEGASAQLKDESASEKLKNILHDKDEDEIIRVSKLLTSDKISKAMLGQSMDEDFIRRIAKSRFVGINPDITQIRRVRRELRKEAKQSTAILNMTLGMVGHDGFKHATQYEIDLRNQQKSRWLKYGVLARV